VDDTMPVREAHELAHQVKDAVQAALPRVNNVTVHIEPFSAPTQ
jgi:divalent metal cation (Fe/Co/Zn/Cd) transporter